MLSGLVIYYVILAYCKYILKDFFERSVALIWNKNLFSSMYRMHISSILTQSSLSSYPYFIRQRRGLLQTLAFFRPQLSMTVQRVVVCAALRYDWHCHAQGLREGLKPISTCWGRAHVLWLCSYYHSSSMLVVEFVAYLLLAQRTARMRRRVRAVMQILLPITLILPILRVLVGFDTRTYTSILHRSPTIPRRLQ